MTRRTAIVVLVAVLVAFAPLAGLAGGAAPSIDNNPTPEDATSTQSEILDGGNLTNFSANSSQNTTFQHITDSNDTKVEILANNDSYVAYANSSTAHVANNSTSNTDNHNVTVGHDELADVEHGIGENTTMTYKMYNNTSVSSPDTSNITFYLEWDNQTTVQNVDDSDVDDGDVVSVAEDPFEVAGTNLTMGPLGADNARVETDERSVNGTDTDVVVVLSNSTVNDDFDAAASDASSGDELSGFKLTRTAVVMTVDDEVVAVPVYQSSTPSGVDDTDDTYALYQDDFGGEDALVINLGADDFDSPDDVEVDAVGNAGLTTFMTTYTQTAVENLMGAMGAGASVLVSGLFAVAAVPGRRRRQRPPKPPREPPTTAAV